ncbi:alpha-glucosidase [soil metagenome]
MSGSPSESPAWWKEAVFYQIYPRSFADSNGDGIGDLPGITSKLDYLKELGLDALWISPIYQSPNDDNGYDISDYLAIGQEYGTLADFDRLAAGLKVRGLKVILDQVLNHTSDEHAWFTESRSSRDNQKRDWYHWMDPKGYDAEGRPIPPNNWKSVFEGSVWEWDAKTEQFYLHLYSRKQPDLNWRNPAVRHALYEVLKTWAGRGSNGFRLDVINQIAKRENYADVPPRAGEPGELLLLDALGCNNPPQAEYLEEMNCEVFAGADLYAVGETWFVGPENTLELTAYDAHRLHGAFYFYFHETATGAEHFQRFYELYQKTHGRSWLTVTLGNHDSRRMLSKFGDPERHPFASATLLATWLLTLPATPFLFQGEELGLTDIVFDTIEEYRDIGMLNRYAADVAAGRSPAEALAEGQATTRDNSRTPMPWSDTPGAGFTSGESWIGIPDSHRSLNATAAVANPGSVFHAYKKLLALRKTVKSLVYGDLEALARPGKVLAYRRGAWEGHPAVCVILNWSSEPQPWPLVPPTSTPLFANYDELDPSSLRPWEARIYVESRR